MAFSVSGDTLYVVNELNCTDSRLPYHAELSELTPLQTVSTLPPSFTGENICAHIDVTPDGRFLYASNRGHDSIAVYRIQEDGQLVLVESFQAEGRHRVTLHFPRMDTTSWQPTRTATVWSFSRSTRRADACFRRVRSSINEAGLYRLPAIKGRNLYWTAWSFWSYWSYGL